MSGPNDPSSIVTAHAVIRWLERKHGIDIQEVRRMSAELGARSNNDGALIQWLSDEGYINLALIREEILDVAMDALSAGATRFVKDGLVYAFAKGRLITILTSDMRLKNKIKKRAFVREASE